MNQEPVVTKREKDVIFYCKRIDDILEQYYGFVPDAVRDALDDDVPIWIPLENTQPIRPCPLAYKRRPSQSQNLCFG